MNFVNGKNKKMKLEQFVIHNNATILEALKKIDSNHKGFILIQNENCEIVGIATDGDIRRLIINNKEINKFIWNDINYNFYFETNLNKFLSEINKKFNIIPIIINDKIIGIISNIL